MLPSSFPRPEVSTEPRAIQSAGRLIPAGGMALTAEQVEDVRRLLDELASERDECDTWDLYERLRALFPATKPAEEETKAEELSNVELSCLKLICDLCKKSYKGTVWLPINDMVQGFVDRHYLTRDENDSCKPTISAEKAIAAASVIPAPTETGPWQTWEAVPDGVTVKSANGERFRKTGVGAIHLLTNGVGDCCKISVANDLQPAPFVAAEEG